MKCIVCGEELDLVGEILCTKCKKLGYIDDLPEECRKKCQNIWSFPECLRECAAIPDEDKYVMLKRFW